MRNTGEFAANLAFLEGLSNEVLLKKLDEFEHSYRNGDTFVLFQTIAFCSHFQAVIPGWAADAILDGERELAEGECRDMNELFGWSNSGEKHKSTRKHQAKIKQLRQPVLKALLRHRYEGGSLNFDIEAESIANMPELVGFDVDKNDIVAVYNLHREEISSIPQKRSVGDNRASCISTVEGFSTRRYGRSILS